MAEYKQYITQIQENGNVMISEDVIATIVENALAEVEAIDSLTAKPGNDIAELIGKTRGKTLKIQIGEDNSLTVACNVIVKYGYSVVDTAKAVQQSVFGALESMTGVKVNAVNVNVCGIVRK